MTQQVILDLKKKKKKKKCVFSIESEVLENSSASVSPLTTPAVYVGCAPQLPRSPSVSVGLGLAFEALQSDADQAATADFGCHLPSLRVYQPELFPATSEVSYSLAVPPHLPHLLFLW